MNFGIKLYPISRIDFMDIFNHSFMKTIKICYYDTGKFTIYKMIF